MASARLDYRVVTMRDIIMILVGFIAGNAIILLAMGLGRAAKD
jgi:hypothetical protein